MNRIPANQLEDINKRLLDLYGSVDNYARYKIVFSEDVFEKRLTSYTDEGFQLLNPEVRELPKYRQWVQNGKYILEQLTIVPEFQDTDIIEKLSYEPVWVFEDKHSNGLYPSIVASKFVIDHIQQNLEQAGNYKKYDDPRENFSKEEEELRLNKIQDELFGNESDAGDALAYREGIVVPSTYMKTTQKES